MHYSDNKTLQQAFNAGVAFAIGRNRVLMAYDSPEWITVHPNGAEHKGRPALIDSATGEVLGGMGGKFTGRHISAVKQGGKFEQMGAQMNVNRVNHKSDMMNNQKIGFYDVENEQEKTTSQYNAQQAKARLNTEEIIKNDAIKQAVLENDGSLLETYLEDLDEGKPFVSKVVTPKDVYTFKDGKWVDSKGSDKLGSISNRVQLDFEEFKKSSDYASNETIKRAENDTLISQGRNLDPKLAQKLDKKQEQINKLSEELDKSSGRTLTQQRGDSTRRAKIDKLRKEADSLKEQLRDKATKSENNQTAENALNAKGEETLQKNKQNNKVSFNGYDFENVSEAKTFLYDAEKTIRGHKEDIASNASKLKQSSKELAQLQTLDQFYKDYKRDNPIFEKTLTEYLRSNKAKYKGIKANELPDMRSSKYWGSRDAERTLNIVKNAHERVTDNLRNKNTEIRDLKRDIEYAKERIPRLQKIIKIGNEAISKLEQ